MSLSDVIPARAAAHMPHGRQISADLARGLGLFAGAAIIGFALFAILLRAGLLGGIEILFYRGIGVALIASALVMGGVILLALRWPQWASVRDGLAAAALVCGLNVSVLTVVPVTIDRSISIFLLGYMDENPDRAFSADQLDRTFRQIYLSDLAQIERRMFEQLATGHVVRTAAGWRITDQGRAFVRTAKRLGAVFAVDTRLLSPSTITGPRQRAASDR
jgi:hypothetical protein